MTLKTNHVLTEILKCKVYKLHETYLKEEYPCFYRKFLHRPVRQNTFPPSVKNVKSKGGEGLCQAYNSHWEICCHCVEISLAQGNFHNNSISNFSNNKETNVFNRICGVVMRRSKTLTYRIVLRNTNATLSISNLEIKSVCSVIMLE